MVIGTDHTLTFSWIDLIDQAEDVIFYGRPFATSRRFDKCFKFKNREEYVFHMFKNIAIEFHGDSAALSLLYPSYLKQING